MTARTTAHLVNALDDRYYDLEKYHGEDGARMAAQSHSAAIDRVERIATAEKIECDFERVDGYLFEPPNESLKNLEKEFDASARVWRSNGSRTPRSRVSKRIAQSGFRGRRRFIR
jgi:hypothetical protein